MAAYLHNGSPVPFPGLNGWLWNVISQAGGGSSGALALWSLSLLGCCENQSLPSPPPSLQLSGVAVPWAHDGGKQEGLATGGVCGGGRGGSRVLVPWRPAGTGGRWGRLRPGAPWGWKQEVDGGERNQVLGSLLDTPEGHLCSFLRPVWGAEGTGSPFILCTPQVGWVGIFSPMSPGLCMTLTFSTTDLALPPPGRQCQGWRPVLGGEWHRVSCRSN